jgi:hypothetical protein
VERRFGARHWIDNPLPLVWENGQNIQQIKAMIMELALPTGSDAGKQYFMGLF